MCWNKDESCDFEGEEDSTKLGDWKLLEIAQTIEKTFVTTTESILSAKKTTRPQKLGDRDERTIVRVLVGNLKLTVRHVKSEYSLHGEVSVDAVLTVLRKNNLKGRIAATKNPSVIKTLRNRTAVLNQVEISPVGKFQVVRWGECFEGVFLWFIELKELELLS